MTTSLFTPLNLAQKARHSPEDLLFFPLDMLEAELRRSPSNRAEIISELMVRAFYREEEKLDGLIAEYLSFSV